jgi:hypothetical protein
MMRDLDGERQTGVEHWRTGVCLAVIALLLYNPFFTILSSSRDVSVQHPLSYRATVAASELRRCTLEPAKPLLPELTAAIFCAAIFLRATDEVGFAQPRDAVAPVSQAPCDSVWFRPPPSA